MLINVIKFDKLTLSLPLGSKSGSIPANLLSRQINILLGLYDRYLEFIKYAYDFLEVGPSFFC